MNFGKLHQKEILGFKDYVHCRNQFRKGMIIQRKQRSVALTENIRLAFENKVTIQYQIQEELYAARTSDEHEILSHIETYKHLLPNGKNLIATLMVEYEDANEAETNLKTLRGIEKTVFLQIEGCERVFPHCNDDLDGQDIVSPVHFLRYELDDKMIDLLKKGVALYAGVAHYTLPLEGKKLFDITKNAVIGDLD